MKMKLDLKKLIKLVISVSLSFPLGNLFKMLALDRKLGINGVWFFTFIGVILGIILGLFVLPFLSDLLANKFLFTKLTSFSEKDPTYLTVAPY
jgi:hypothetical protein